VAVNAAYAEAGFGMAQEVREMPDHIGIELAFVATLYEREADLLRRGATRKATAVRQSRQRFLAEHPGAWLSGFPREASQRTTLAFYKTLARLAANWVEQDRRVTSYILN